MARSFARSRTPRFTHKLERRSRAACLAVASAAAVVSLAAPSSAQTWLNPNTGSWSVPGNWVNNIVPVSGATTVVNFNAVAAQSYSAFQNIAAPFTLNAINFNNSGSGLITVSGQQIQFAGTNPAINQSGSGNATISAPVQLAANTSLNGAGSGTISLGGALSSLPAATGTTGSSYIQNSASARSVLSGGGTLYGLRANTGSMFVQGGAWTLTSTQRGNDPFGGVNDGGFWSVVAGNTAGQTASVTFSNSAVIGAQNAFTGTAAGQTGVLTFSGGGTTGNFPTSGTEGRVGVSFGTGSFNVLSGAVVNARRADIGRQASSTGFLTVDGFGSRINSTTLDFALDANAAATGVVSNGGVVSLTNGALSVAFATTPGGAALTSNASLTVSGASSISVGGTGVNNTGQFAAGIGGAGVPAAATINLTGGGRIDAQSTFLGSGAGAATMNVNGGVFVTRDQLRVDSVATSRLTVSGGGSMNVQGNTFLATGASDTVLFTVTGANSVAELGSGSSVGFAVFSGGNGSGVPGGTSTVSIASGGEIRSNLIVMAQNPSARSFVGVDGANSRLTIGGNNSQLIIADDANATGTLNVTNGGRVTIASAGAAMLSTHPNSISAATFTGANSLLDASSLGAQLHVGGFDNTVGGTATFSVNGGGAASVNDLLLVYTPGTMNVGAGTSPGTVNAGTLAVNGTVNYNAGTLNANTLLSVAGSVLLSNAARDAGGTPSNKKTVVAQALSMTGSAVIDLNDNDMIVRSGTRQAIEQRVATARNGGAWNMPGITSTAAKNNPQGNTTLGVLDGSDYISINGNVFNGRTVSNSDRLVKYTFYGDTDFNGFVDGDDYARTDNGFNTGASGWFNGDFDLNGFVDGDDYALIDAAFNTQTGTLSRFTEILAGPNPLRAIEQVTGLTTIEKIAAGHARMFGEQYMNSFLSAVPEPGATAFVAVSFSSLLGARRRRR
jgi:T5SS/PEP-CTERM-associated repeat protein